MVFDTANPLYIVKDDHYNKQGGSHWVEFEVPWREGTMIRSAIHLDLLKILALVHVKGDYDATIADKTRIPEPDTTSAAYYYFPGVSYHAKGDYEATIADETRAIELNPTNLLYHEQRAFSYREKGDYPAAFTDINHILTFDPSNADYYLTRGTIYKLADDIPTAVLTSKKPPSWATRMFSKNLPTFPKVCSVPDLLLRGHPTLPEVTDLFGEKTRAGHLRSYVQ